MKKTEALSHFADSKHVEFIGLAGNESKIRYDEFSTVKLEILFCAKSPKESNLALLEIVEKAAEIFNVQIETYSGEREPNTTRLSKALKDVQNINKEVAEGTE